MLARIIDHGHWRLLSAAFVVAVALPVVGSLVAAGWSNPSRSVADGAATPDHAAIRPSTSWLSGGASPGSAEDVGGNDIGPVDRYPGLVRDYFQRYGLILKVRYQGKADFQAVLSHYTRGFEAAGYRQAVLNGSREAEHYRYYRGGELVEFKLTRKADGFVELELESIPERSRS